MTAMPHYRDIWAKEEDMDVRITDWCPGVHLKNECRRKEIFVVELLGILKIFLTDELVASEKEAYEHLQPALPQKPQVSEEAVG